MTWRQYVDLAAVAVVWGVVLATAFRRTCSVLWRWHRGGDVHTARGDALTLLARVYGLERRRVWWVFRESDRSLRRRCRALWDRSGWRP